MMEQDYERYDLRVLLDLYMKESKEFSAALQEGASWQQLQDTRQRIRLISTLINKKYEATYGAERTRHRPPHGD